VGHLIGSTLCWHGQLVNGASLVNVKGGCISACTHTAPCFHYIFAFASERAHGDATLPVQVWSEPSMVEAGAYEFADTAKFLSAGEMGHVCSSNLANPDAQVHVLLSLNMALH